MYFSGRSAGQKRYEENKGKETKLAALCWGFKNGGLQNGPGGGMLTQSLDPNGIQASHVELCFSMSVPFLLLNLIVSILTA